MAPIGNSAPPGRTPDQQIWNEAHDRLRDYFQAFALADHSQVSRLTLAILEEVRREGTDPAGPHPTRACLERAQTSVVDWLATNLESTDDQKGPVFISGSLALVLSQTHRIAPDYFLTATLAEDRRRSLQQALLVTGPDLNFSSMTPRHIDYGPIHVLAKQTWHRWNLRDLLIAVIFWTAVYYILYFWLSDVL